MYTKFNFEKKYKKLAMEEIFLIGKSIKNSDAGQNFSILKEMYKKFDVWENFSIRKTFVMGENFFNGKKVV